MRVFRKEGSLFLDTFSILSTIVATKKKQSRAPRFLKRLHRHVKLAVVPHAANDYRPHAIRRYGLAGLLLLVFLLQGTYNSVTTGSVLGVTTDVTPYSLLAATNDARQSEGKQELALNEQLSEAARLKAEDMLKNQYWAHTSPSGVTPWDWFGKVGYSYSDAGENLAKNFTTSNAVISAWLQSPTHRANLLKAEFEDVGFATVSGTLDGRAVSIIVAMYGAPATPLVQGVTLESNTGQAVSLVARLGLGIQSLTPAAIGSVLLLLVGANVALLAHLYRQKLPKKLQQTWYKHHGIYKAVALCLLAGGIVFAYGSLGQL